MAKRPLNLNWKELAPRISEGGGGGGSMELEVVNSSTRFAAGPTCEMEQKDGSPELLTDHQLDEKIQRARQLVDGLNLPDGGRKLRIRLKSLEEEKERRRLEKDSTSFEHFRQTNHPRSKDSLLVSTSSSSVSSSSSSLPFFDASGERFAKPDICTGSSGVAFDEELSLLNSAKLTEQNQFSGKPNERDSTGWSMSMGNSMSCIPSRASIGQAGNRKVVVASNSSLCPSHSLTRSKQNDSEMICLTDEGLCGSKTHKIWLKGRYLEKGWEHLKDGLSLPNFPISYRVWRQLPSKIRSRVIEVPQQNNPYDCGLFVLYFIQRFIEDAPERVRMKDLAMFGRKWFEPEEASGLREHLKRLLQNEFEGARLVACDESP